MTAAQARRIVRIQAYLWLVARGSVAAVRISRHRLRSATSARYSMGTHRYPERAWRYSPFAFRNRGDLVGHRAHNQCKFVYADFDAGRGAINEIIDIPGDQYTDARSYDCKPARMLWRRSDQRHGISTAAAKPFSPLPPAVRVSSRKRPGRWYKQERHQCFSPRRWPQRVCQWRSWSRTNIRHTGAALRYDADTVASWAACDVLARMPYEKDDFTLFSPSAQPISCCRRPCNRHRPQLPTVG